MRGDGAGACAHVLQKVSIAALEEKAGRRLVNVSPLTATRGCCTDLVTADFGSQIRNYVMHPYKLVKDTRSGHETSDVAAILDGDLDSFLAQYLRHESAGQRTG